MSNSKDKRTKEEILRLLDNALTQEELLAEKIKVLQTELADCRKKADNPRHELTEEAMPASKVSFRIDYYRTSEESPLKGIIEHLPSRQNKSFEGEGQLIVNHFMNRFLTEETGTDKKKKTSVEEKPKPALVSAGGEKGIKAIERIVLHQEDVITSGSQLLQRLKAEFAAAQNRAANEQTQTTKPPAKPPVMSLENKIAAQIAERRSRTNGRMREEQRQRFRPR